jgi:CheY-like chemotaxis protein
LTEHDKKGSIVATILSRHFRPGVDMNDPTASFGDVAQKLARNPLGIIALFIVLVYGFAALVAGFSSSFIPSERLPLIYFMIIFPVLVLGVFGWLVSRHSNSLFAPSDFRNEDNYVRALTATASLAVASVKSDSGASVAQINSVVESVREASASRPRGWSRASSRNHILWVDDRPENNINERGAFEALGITFSLARTTNEALAAIGRHQFAAIISDMGRKEGPREGYALLDKLRASGDQTPLFFYAASDSPDDRRETIEHGGQGSTNNPQELFRMVMRVVLSS